MTEEIITEAQALLAAAMRARLENRAHVFVDYSPHVDWVHVYALPASTRYVDGEKRTYLMDDRASSADELRALRERVDALGR